MNQVSTLLQNDWQTRRVDIEYHSRFQIPSIQILGLPSAEIQEAKERIQSAFEASKIELPKQRVLINLAPSELKKTGTGYDLAIALRIAIASLGLRFENHFFAWGELGLDGKIKSVGHLARFVELVETDALDDAIVFIPRGDHARVLELHRFRNRHGLAPHRSIRWVAVDQLIDVISILKNGFPKPPSPPADCPIPTEQETHRPILPPYRTPPALPISPLFARLLSVIFSGRHHGLLLGPKGIGKSAALEAISPYLDPSPPDTTWERLKLNEADIDGTAPIRRIHAHVRPGALLGKFHPQGFRPGELAQAHGGVMIADEFPEWHRDSKESLREPLERKRFTLARAQGSVEIPCDFQWLGTGNLCPCGGTPVRFEAQATDCKCSPPAVDAYLKKLSGPILDRIDVVGIMRIEDRPRDQVVPETLGTRIREAKNFAREHYGGLGAEIESWRLEKITLDSSSEKLIRSMKSLRSRHKTLRVAITLQALDRAKRIELHHIGEAMSYRGGPLMQSAS